MLRLEGFAFLYKCRQASHRESLEKTFWYAFAIHPGTTLSLNSPGLSVFEGLADSPNASRLVGGHCSVDAAGDAPAISRGSAIWPLGHVQRNRKDAIGALALTILAQ